VLLSCLEPLQALERVQTHSRQPTSLVTIAASSSALIKPYAFELAAVASLLAKYKQRDQKGFVIESLWKFLLYTEIALAAYQEFQTRPPGVGMATRRRSYSNILTIQSHLRWISLCV
jgi:hypothetical protein